MRQFWYLIPFMGIYFWGCAAGSIKNGLADGRLAACPGSPNCVSSQARDERHGIAPLSFSGDAKDALDRLCSIVSGMKGGRVVERRDNYVHATFTSSVFRFVDDLEFLADGANHVIDVRSASRMGYSDFGVNRRRVEQIRKLFTAPR
jgi:uncharacterized protein (DUF1499 family)